MATYHIDEGAARRATKSPHLNLSYQTAKEAEEVAEKLAKKLNRAVNIYELDPDRKQEYGTIEPLRQHYALVYPDGKVKKSKDGVSPVVEYGQEGDEDGKSLEEKLELPRVALGKMNSTLRTVDSVLAQMKRRGAPETIRKKLHAVADAVAHQIRAASPSTVEINKRITAKLRVGDVFEAGLMRLEIAAIDQRIGNMTVKLNRDPVAIWDATTVARIIMGNEMRRVKAGPEVEEQAPTESHHLAPGDVALVDEDKKAFVLDSADGVYVVLMDGMVTTVEDDANRIGPIDDAILPEGRRVRRIWATFFKQALVRFNVKSVSEMDSERKTKFFDFIRVKWPRIEKTMLNDSEEQEQEQAPEAPVEPEQQVESSKSQVQAWDPDEPDEGPEDLDEGVDPSEISSELLEMLHESVKKAIPGQKVEIDPSKGDGEEFAFDVWTNSASMTDLLAKLKSDQSLKSAEMVGEGDEAVIHVVFADDVVKDVDSQLSEGWEDPGDRSVPGTLPSQPSRKPFKS